MLRSAQTEATPQSESGLEREQRETNASFERFQARSEGTARRQACAEDNAVECLNGGAAGE